MRFCKTIFLTFVLLCLAATAALAASRADELRSNPNFIAVYANEKGETAFLRIHSVSVQEYNPPVYQIAAVVTRANEDAEYDVYETYRYNYDNQTIWKHLFGKWTCLAPASSAQDNNDALMAEMMFKYAYGIDFVH